MACVGHEPWMSDTLALLTTGTPDGTWLRFKKGAIAWLRGPPTPAAMELRALLPPRGQDLPLPNPAETKGLLTKRSQYHPSWARNHTFG